ncbi:unnamed protein product [Linum tenue]|uniref:Uncharacterized protein n=1 Tax=Linum tenue TaxID=586396 RepID=A0AAV0NKR7_9ROSI|nr:unnamed protein product [Linum tenue]
MWESLRHNLLLRGPAFARPLPNSQFKHFLGLVSRFNAFGPCF